MKSNKSRPLLISIRQAILIALAALEDYLGMKRSVVTRKEKRQQRHGDDVV